MDLVDIDQVLDNLELCEAEDESRAAVATEASNRHLAAVNETAQMNGLSSAGNSNKGNNSIQKSFVGVSQVFNSLDDYCKNVKSLGNTSINQKYDEECRPLIVHTTLNSNKTETLNSSYVNKSYEDEDDCDEACSDINKFKEEERRHKWAQEEEDNDNVDVVFSSDSLTTSSSSTFSSGPSPGAISTADENSTYLSPINARNIEIEHSVSMNDSIESVEEDSHIPQNLQTESELKVNEGPDSSAPVEDIAQGLSTISLTASTTANSQLILPCESNVSSALKNVLDQLSDTESSSILSQQPDEEPKLIEIKENVRNSIKLIIHQSNSFNSSITNF